MTIEPKRRFKDRLADLFYAIKGLIERLWGGVDHQVEKAFGTPEGDKALAQAFKSDAEFLENAPVPLSAHVALFTVLGLLVAAVIWSIIGSVDRIVVAPGKIATRTPLIVMQPYTTSRIQQILVQPGDHVKKGQVLVAFDPAFAQADVASLDQKVRAFTAESTRLEAQLADKPFQPADPTTSEAKIQQQIYAQEHSSFQAELAQRDSRISGLDAQMRALVAAVAGLEHQLAMAKKVVGIYQGLMDQKAGAPLDVMKAQSSAIDVEMRLKNTQGDLNKLADQRKEVQAERASFLERWRSEHNEKLVKSRQDLAEAAELLNKAKRLKDFSDLKAPANAVVLEIAARSVGSVLREAETILTLVPDGATLYAEANIPSRDISHVKVGNPVRVKLEAYPFQKYGTIDGELAVLSADSVPLKEDDQSTLVYHARVKILESPADLIHRGLRMRPGMVMSAEIKTGRRSIASYVMNPILRTADESLSEP